MCDRTQEFLQCASLAGAKVARIPEVPKTKTAFHDAAADIARGVHRTSLVLNKLTKLVRRQGLFDDPTEEINNLIFRIKQDLDELNTKCDSAQQYVDGKKKSLGDKNQLTTHNGKVVSHLKTDLMNATKDFKTVLEMRSCKMKESQQRKVQLTGNATVSPMRQFSASSLVQSAQKTNLLNQNQKYAPMNVDDSGGAHSSGKTMGGVASPYNSVSTTANNDFLEEGNNGINDYSMQQSQQLLLAPPAASMYYDTRVQAVTEVEKTIGELGTLFKRLATMISEQQELVERIDDDVEQAVSNSDRAHMLLVDAYNKASSNRALYTKLGAIFAIFILFFILFLM